jgi:hypothetical protein
VGLERTDEFSVTGIRFTSAPIPRRTVVGLVATRAPFAGGTVAQDRFHFDEKSKRDPVLNSAGF